MTRTVTIVLEGGILRLGASFGVATNSVEAMLDLVEYQEGEVIDGPVKGLLTWASTGRVIGYLHE